LEDDLELSPSPHSLFSRIDFSDKAVEVPLLVCSSKTDLVVSPIAMHRGLKLLKNGALLFWQCLDGRHFFHHLYREEGGEKILKFWLSLQPPSKFKFKIYGRVCYFLLLN
jgi:hypothetical protein